MFIVEKGGWRRMVFAVQKRVFVVFMVEKAMQKVVLAVCKERQRAVQR